MWTLDDKYCALVKSVHSQYYPNVFWSENILKSVSHIDYQNQRS